MSIEPATDEEIAALRERDLHALSTAEAIGIVIHQLPRLLARVEALRAEIAPDGSDLSDLEAAIERRDAELLALRAALRRICAEPTDAEVEAVARAVWGISAPGAWRDAVSAAIDAFRKGRGM